MKIQCPHCGIEFEYKPTDDETINVFGSSEVLYAPNEDNIEVILNADSLDFSLLNGKIVCFTGFIHENKNLLLEMAKENNVSTRTSVSKKLDYLICGKNPGPSKLQKAKELDIKVIDIEELIIT